LKNDVQRRSREARLPMVKARPGEETSGRHRTRGRSKRTAMGKYNVYGKNGVSYLDSKKKKTTVGLGFSSSEAIKTPGSQKKKENGWGTPLRSMTGNP